MSGKLLFQLPALNPHQAEWQPKGANYIALATQGRFFKWVLLRNSKRFQNVAMLEYLQKFGIPPLIK